MGSEIIRISTPTIKDTTIGINARSIKAMISSEHFASKLTHIYITAVRNHMGIFTSRSFIFHRQPRGNAAYPYEIFEPTEADRNIMTSLAFNIVNVSLTQQPTQVFSVN